MQKCLTGCEIFNFQHHSFSDNPAARPNVQKSMILVLSHSPEEDVMPAEDAVKDLHDQRIELYVLAIGDGRRNKLERIALKKNIFMASDAANAVSVLRYLSQFVVGKLGKGINF